MSQPKIGFVGLGIMGAPMARNLLKADYSLTVFNRTKSKMDPLIEEGAQGGESPSEVAQNSDIIITIVSDTPDVEEVIASKNGVLEGIKSDSIVVDMSTVAPEMERELDRKLKEKSCSLVDAPVSGGDIGAQKGTLAIMAGGEKQDFERVRPLFEVMGQTITYCGPVGNGQLTKLCNQILVSINLLGVSEALSFARKNGLDPKIMINAIRGGAAGSWQLSNLGPRIVDRDFAPGFMVDLMQKDLKIVLQTADLSGSVVPAASLVHQLFNNVQSQGGGQEGTQALARVLEMLAGLKN